MARPSPKRYRLMRGAIFSASVLSFLPLMSLVRERSNDAAAATVPPAAAPTAVPAAPSRTTPSNQSNALTPSQSSATSPQLRTHTRTRAS